MYKPADLPPKPPKHYTREPLAECRLIAGHGIEGDCKAGRADRHINLMSTDTLARLAEAGFHSGPGQMGEQIIVSGVEVEALRPGDRLYLGDDACLEVVKPRTGCQRFLEIQGQPVPAASGGLGVMMRVLSSGTIHVGDAIRLQAAAKA
jgi:MOSC domain-containing protein YiiM